MKVYVVVEDDRGCGPMVCGVFVSKAKAEEYVAESSHCWISEEELNEEE